MFDIPSIAEGVWQDLKHQGITDATTLQIIIEDLKENGVANISKLLEFAGRDKKVVITNLNLKNQEQQEESGQLSGLTLRGVNAPALKLRVGKRSRIVRPFFLLGKNKIIKAVDEFGNVLYENY